MAAGSGPGGRGGGWVTPTSQGKLPGVGFARSLSPGCDNRPSHADQRTSSPASTCAFNEQKGSRVIYCFLIQLGRYAL